MQHTTKQDNASIESARVKDKIQEETLKRLYHKSEEEKANGIAIKFKLPYVDLSLIPVTDDAVNSVPEQDAKRANLAVIYKVGKKYQIAVTDPENYETKKYLEKIKKDEDVNFSLVIVSNDSLNKAWASYGKGSVSETYENRGMTLKQEDLTEFEKGIGNLIELKKRIAEIHTTEVFNIIMAGAIKTKASDIHIEPQNSQIRLRYRIDGVLQDIINLPKTVHKTIVSRLKMLAKMKLNVSDVPQDGHFSIDLENTTVNVRASLLPTSFGESIVMRLLSESAIGLKLDELGFNQYYLELIEEQMLKPNGMILTTGPTGSGKTTTLYAMIHRLNEPSEKIITLENPVEYKIEGITQTEVGENMQISFAEGLRSVVRQDPDIIMVGEVRDPETAETAIQAALTGHIVISTLHTNSAAGAIPRLLHLKVNPALIAPAINAVIAQRLVRKLCAHCKEEYVPAQETLDKIKEIVDAMPKNDGLGIPAEIKNLHRSRGCAKCNFIGYSGRIGIYEMFGMSSGIEAIILGDTSSSQMLEAARKDGMVTMKEDGIIKALNGTTSLEEIRRVTGEIFSKKGFIDRY